MVPKTLLDSDILSALMRRDAKATIRAREYLDAYPQLSFSLITRCEIMRGLKAKRAFEQLNVFESFCATCNVIAVNEVVVVHAADIYADLYGKGALIGDADILIAATALTHGFVLATNNAAHFDRVAGLDVDNWLA